jgi:small subunit ribosomal protein S21
MVHDKANFGWTHWLLCDLASRSPFENRPAATCLDCRPSHGRLQHGGRPKTRNIARPQQIGRFCHWTRIRKTAIRLRNRDVCRPSEDHSYWPAAAYQQFLEPRRNGINVQVLVRDNNVDQALRALKKKMQREGIFREMKMRDFYEKPSQKRAREKAEAVRRVRKLARKRAQREGLVSGGRPAAR